MSYEQDCGGGRRDRNSDAMDLCDDDVHQAPELVVPCHSVTVLSGSPAHRSERAPRVMHTQDLRRLKALVGVPDEAVRGRSLVDRDDRRLMERLCRDCGDHEKRAAERGDQGKAQSVLTGRAEFARAVRSNGDAAQSQRSIRAHARSFLYADSSAISESRPVVEAFYRNFEILTWLFPKVVVKSGSVLAFGPGMNYLRASELVIEEGGQIVSTGSLSVRVTGPLRKKTPIVVGPALDLSLALKTAFRDRF